LSQIKLALDVHAASIVVARMVDGAKPQPPWSFPSADFLAWARKQKALAQRHQGKLDLRPTARDWVPLGIVI